MGTTRARKTTPTAAEKRRRAAQAAKDAAESNGNDPGPEQPEGDEQIKLEHGVAVFRVDQGNGGFGFVVQAVGDVRVTEIGDILEYGLKAHRTAIAK